LGKTRSATTDYLPVWWPEDGATCK